MVSESETHQGRTTQHAPWLKQLRPFLALVVTLMLWASTFPAMRLVLKTYTPGHLILLRFLIASLTLTLYGAWRRIGLPRKRDMLVLALAGLFGVIMYQGAIAYGQVSFSSGPAAVLVDTIPIFTALFASLFLRERLSRLGWSGIALSFLGALLIAWGEGGEQRFSPAALLFLLAAICLSAYFIIQKPLLERYSALAFTCYTTWVGTACMLVFLPGLIESVHTAPIGTTLLVVYLGIFPAALAFVTWGYVLSRLPVSNAASFLYLTPPLTFLIAWIWLGEIPTLLSLIGGCSTLLGVVLVQLRGRQ
jgi:drug/metabolite transporter (DMT)-like permease